MSKIYTALHRDEVDRSIHPRGSWRVGEIDNVTYDMLVDVLGEPTFDESGDGKVMFEWVVPFENNEGRLKHFTIYDWKTYDRNYSRYHCTEWNVGGDSSSSEFVSVLEEKIASLVSN